MDQVAGQYGPFILFFIIASSIGVVNVTVGIFLRPRRATRVKGLPYECGMEPSGTPNEHTHRAPYAFFAMLLVLFDVEAAFLVPWALHARALGTGGLAAVSLFFLVLGVGYAYLWRKGDLEWR